jgi:hypothetical protein
MSSAGSRQQCIMRGEAGAVAGRSAMHQIANEAPAVFPLPCWVLATLSLWPTLTRAGGAPVKRATLACKPV